MNSVFVVSKKTKVWVNLVKNRIYLFFLKFFFSQNNYKTRSKKKRYISSSFVVFHLHVTCDMWYMKHDMWHIMGVNLITYFFHIFFFSFWIVYWNSLLCPPPPLPRSLQVWGYFFKNQKFCNFWGSFVRYNSFKSAPFLISQPFSFLQKTPKVSYATTKKCLKTCGLLWTSKKDVCRTAFATPGLFKIY